jgi:serine/threonine-protein kinase RsbW/sigma-B regulation protein RsbU (phosphoserine phosphatase)
MNGVRTVITERNDDGLARVQALLDGLAKANPLACGPVADMQVALDEILSNTLRHGFNDGLPHRIEVTLSVEPTMLVAEIEDDCAAFDPLAVAPPELKGSLEAPRIGGLGIYFVRSLMSEVSYARVGTRNRLVLKKLVVEAAQRR